MRQVAGRASHGASQAAPIERADLRYTNGFTLSWGTPPADAPKKTQERT